MADVEIVIKIPEEIYEMVMNTGTYGCYRFNSTKAIREGIPLDDIKAEMEKQIERDFAFAETETLKVPCHYGIANGYQNAIRLLDNIGKKESEK